MRADEVRDLDTKELGLRLRDMTDQIFHLRFQMRMGQMDGLKKYRALRKDRARILTVLAERERQAAGEAAAVADKKG